MEPVIGYIRVSTMEQAQDGVSLELQRDRLAAYAELYDLEIIDIIEDAGVSGKSLRRDGLDAVLGRMEAGEASGVLVYKLDRLTRSVADLGALIEKYFAGKYRLLSVQDQIDTSTANGRFVCNLLGSVAQWEREVISERTTAALRHKKQNGEVYNHVPLGYQGVDGKLVAVDEELVIVSEVRSMRQGGLSYHKIANDLNGRGIIGKRGGRFYASTIRAIVQNDLHEAA